MSDNFLESLFGFVDESQLAYVQEEQRDSINRARLIQGDASLGLDPNLKNTVHYLGGIGLSVDNLPEEIKSKCTIKELESGQWAVLPQLDVVVLASSPNRRYYAELDGKKQLFCGSNQDGANAVGWSGVDCKSCQFHKKNFAGDKRDACKSYLSALIYIPSLDHTAIFTASGASYMEARAWLDQVSVLSKALAQQPVFQSKNPGMKRVNTWFFKTTLKPSKFFDSDDGKKYQKLDFSKAEQPFDWPKLVNSPDVMQKVKEIWGDIEEHWAQMYVAHNPKAKLSLPSAPGPAGLLPAVEVKQIESKVTIAAPEVIQPTQTAAPTMPVQAQVVETPVSTITLDDIDDPIPVAPVPIGEVEMF